MGVTNSDVIDFSAHLYPDPSPIGENSSTLRRVLDETEGRIFHDFDLARQRFQKGGLDGAVLSQPPFFNSDDLTVTEEANDNLLSLVDQFEHYYSLAALPTAAGPKVAAREFERCLSNGYNGGVIETWTHRGSDATHKLDPIFEIADEYNAPLLLHPKVSDSLGPDVLSDNHRSNAVFARNAALANCVYLLIHQGYFDRYTGLNLVVHHMGGAIVSMFGQIRCITNRALTDAQNAKSGREVELKPFEEFEEQFREHIYLDTCGYDGEFSNNGSEIDRYPSTNIVMGSDYPCETRTADDYKRHIRSIKDVVPPEGAKRILAQNALDLLINT